KQWGVAKRAQGAQLTAELDALFNAPPNELADRIENLSSFGRQAVSEATIWSRSYDKSTRLRALLFLNSVEPRQFGEIIPLLGMTPPEFIGPVLKIASQADDAIDELTAAATKAKDPVVALRASILLAHLSDDVLLRNHLKGSLDGAADYDLIMQAIDWKHDPRLWAKIVSNRRADTRVRYFATLILGAYPQDQLRRAELSLDFDDLVNHPDSTVHAAGRYLAECVGNDCFDIPLNPGDDANWILGPGEIPMIRFEPEKYEYEPVTPATAKSKHPNIVVDIDRPFWMSSIPVSQKLYARFDASDAVVPEDSDARVTVEDVVIRQDILEDKNQPMLATTLAEACTMCNWLSRQEGLEECYEYQPPPAVLSEGSRVSLRKVPWSLDREANGYRLPLTSEFEAAALGMHRKGTFWRIAEQICRSSGYEGKFDYSSPLFSLVPSPTGVFCFDQHRGAWISTDGWASSISARQSGFGKGLHLIPRASPGVVMFLARTAEE
ncbi:MAG: SUMF1/EgtB/PvdO family nonheme iron enzyme, partial [Planctomycetota bacterium]